MLDSVKMLGGRGLEAVRRQRSKRRLRGRLDRSGLSLGSTPGFRCVVYFADDPVNLYQIRQWYAPLVALSKVHPVVVLSRTPETTLMLLNECPLPVLYAPGVTHIESFMSSQDVGLVLYVNQNLRNFQMLRFARPAHVFVSHGESDKSYMASNQLKAYDRVFVAGRAAMVRLHEALIEYDVEARAVPIGRPQSDVIYPSHPLPHDGRTTVLYAPTWEGDRLSMHYGSVSSHGRRLARALLADNRFRLVYRPHPRSGSFDSSYGEDSQGIVQMIEAANRANPSPRHLVDLHTDFGWHLSSLDTCISDISAVALDWLSTGKPLVLTKPAEPHVHVQPTGLSAVVPFISVTNCDTIVAVLDRAMTGPDPRTAEVVEHYFGDTTPGAATKRFIEACDVLVRERLALER